MRKLPLIALTAALGLAAMPAMAAPKAAAKPAAKPAAGATSTGQPPAEVQDAMLYLKVVISALQSDTVEQPVKGALVGCLYNNSLGKITDSMDKLIAANPGKISKDNPNQMLSGLATICGYRPTGAAAGATAPATPAAPATKAPAGR